MRGGGIVLAITWETEVSVSLLRSVCDLVDASCLQSVNMQWE